MERPRRDEALTSDTATPEDPPQVAITPEAVVAKSAKRAKVSLPEIDDDSTRLDTRSDAWVNTFLLVLTLAYMVRALTAYGAEARLMPLAAAVPALVLLAKVTYDAALPQVRSLRARRASDGGVEQAEDRRRGDRRNGYLSIGWVTLAMLVPMMLGFLVGYPLFLLVYLLVHGKESRLFAVLYTTAFVAFVYWFFVIYIGIRPYEGLFDLPSRVGLG